MLQRTARRLAATLTYLAGVVWATLAIWLVEV